MTDYGVTPDQLRAHAGTLSGYADRLAGLGNGLPGSLADQSLGAFSQFLTTRLGTAMSDSLNAFGHASSTVDMVAEGLRKSADGYQTTDDSNATTVSNIGGDL